MLVQSKNISLPILKRTAYAQAGHIKLIEGSPIDGNTTDPEQRALIALVQELRLADPQIFEFGTFDGRTAINLAHHTNGSVFTLDLPQDCGCLSLRIYGNAALRLFDRDYMPHNQVKKRLRLDKDQNITRLYGDSAAFDFLPHEKRFDFVFIDGGHSKEYIENDTEVAFKLLRTEGGLIVWHDYGDWPEVTAYLHEKYDNDERFKDMFQIESTSLTVLKV